ncbi:MMPL family transporter, partial [Pseudomonas syringae]|uniref:MMPL family transporter n=1 Tax=Pseudomonas syringae TaxID=317 RepID=UPI001CA95219
SISLVRKLIKEVHSRFPGVEAGLTGEDVIAADEMAITQIDVQNASQIALLGVALLFIISYRGLVKPLLAVFSLIIALCWSIGWATLVVGHLNILTIVFTTILIGLGIDFGIHILERYKEERVFGNDVLHSLQKTIQGTGRGNFAGAVT